MTMEQGGFTDSKGRALHTYSWVVPGEGEVTGLVFLCHGYAERLIPYYTQLAEEGRKRGLLCFGHDHVGHGQSEGERVQVGDMAEYVDPVITHCKAMTDKYPNTPLFIVGHSMGGLITLLTILKTQVKQYLWGLSGPSEGFLIPSCLETEHIRYSLLKQLLGHLSKISSPLKIEDNSKN